MGSIKDSPYLKNIFTAIESGKCLPFLGAGASTFYSYGDKKYTGLPLGGDFTKMFNAAAELNGHGSTDFAIAAEHVVFHSNGDRTPLEKIIRDEIKKIQDPRPIHTAIAQIRKIQHVITTNYDEMLEAAVRSAGRMATRHVHDQNNPNTGVFQCDDPTPPDDEIRLHKMHGTWEQPGTMIITRSDYIRYLTRMTDERLGMPYYFRREVIPRHTLLFLGYSVSDWNFLVIWEGMLAAQQSGAAGAKTHYAIMFSCSPFDKEFLERRNIKVIEGDLTEFACLLAERFKFEIPQIQFKPSTAGGAP